MLRVVQNIPDIKMSPLKYIFEVMKYDHRPDTLWLEFGVFSGRTINYISQFTTDTVYGFDSFEGLPEKWRPGFDKGVFSKGGKMPDVNKNVTLVKGWFDATLPTFMEENAGKKVSFIHMDADLYSSTKCIFDNVKNHLEKNCVIVFDELLNYPGFDGPNGELRAFYEFVTENKVSYSWIGMDGFLGSKDGKAEHAAVMIHSVS